MLMRWMFLKMLLVMVLILILSGCAQPVNLTKLPTSEIVNAATNRWGSWERVRKDEEKTKQDVAKAEKAKAEVDKLRLASRENVQIIIDSKDELQTYALSKANDNLAEANRILGQAVDALSGTKSVYADLSTTPMPQGAFAEGIKATGDAVAKVANTPAAMIVNTGLAARWILDKANAGAPNQFNLAKGDLNAKGSFNNIDAIASGAESSVTIPFAAEQNPITTTMGE